MKHSGKLIFINYKLRDFNDDVVKILGLDLIRYMGKDIEDIFSEETCYLIFNMKSDSSATEKICISKSILDAKLTKTSADGVEILVVDIKDAPIGWEPLNKEPQLTNYEKIAIGHMSNINFLLNNVETKSNSNKLKYIKRESFDLLLILQKLFMSVSNRKIENADINYTFVNLWNFFNELKKEIQEFENVQLNESKAYCYNVYINTETVKELIKQIVSNISIKGHRVYVSTEIINDRICLRIANFMSKISDNKDMFEIDEGEMRMLLDMRRKAFENNLVLEQKVYSEERREYILQFKSDKIAKVCESD